MANKKLDIENLYRDLGWVINGNMVASFLHAIAPPAETPRVLEMGSGSGKLAISYAMNSSEAVALDIDPAAIDYGSRLWKAVRALHGQPPHMAAMHFIHMDLFKSQMIGEFHLVFNEGVVNHWPDDEPRQQVIQLMVDRCAPGGIVCVMGSNGHRQVERDIDRNVKFNYEGMPPTRRSFTDMELIEKLQKAGLRQVRVDGIIGDLSTAQILAGWGVKGP